MSLLGCEWESIERHEKLRGVVWEWVEGTRRRERNFAVFLSHSCSDEETKARWPPEFGITYFWPQLTKDNVQRKLFKFQGR